MFATDVVFYYVAAEVKELRKIACRETHATGRDAGATSYRAGGDARATYRAREFYHGSEDQPTEPYCDLWSDLEFGKAKWLEKMAAAFG